MKTSFLLSLCLTTSLALAGQNETSRIISDAAHEGLDNSQTQALLDYFEMKSHLLPSQRNAAPIGGLSMGNPGFENGNFFGWTGYIGDNMMSMYSTFSNLQSGIFTMGNDAAITNSAARHTIVSSVSGNDYYGGFSVVQAGNYSVRLGGQTPNYQGEILEQTFTVDPGSPYIKISYAAVLNSPPFGHLDASMPFFLYELKDNTGNMIDSVRIKSNDSTLSLSGLLAPQGDPVYYCTWRTDSIPLSAYIGTDVTLTFTVAGCTQSGHFGYCYVDVDYPYTNSVSEYTQSELNVFPNPANSIIHVKSSDMNISPILVNTLGQIQDTKFSGSVDEWSADISSLSPGVYFIEWKGEQGILTKRIVVE